MNNFIFNISDKIDINSGTKTVELMTLKKIGINVPRFWSVNCEEYYRFLETFSITPIDQFLLSTYYDPLEIQKIYATNGYLGSNFITDKPLKLIARSSSVPTENFTNYASMISGAFESYECDVVTLPVSIAAVYASLYSEKSFHQLKLAKLEKGIKGMAVLIQEYIEPKCSGVLHAYLNKPYMEVNWVEGHLRSIVSGSISGDYDQIYENHGEVILRGRENQIYCVLENNYCGAFLELYYTAKRILDFKKINLEIEWIYSNQKIYIVQCQELIAI